MEKTNRKIGIMGGTFDPIHIGHLILGEAAYEQFGLDEVWFLPAGNPPHKRNRAGQAKDAQRVEMVRRAIASNPHFVLCTKRWKMRAIPTVIGRLRRCGRNIRHGVLLYHWSGFPVLF